MSITHTAWTRETWTGHYIMGVASTDDDSAIVQVIRQRWSWSYKIGNGPTVHSRYMRNGYITTAREAKLEAEAAVERYFESPDHTYINV